MEMGWKSKEMGSKSEDLKPIKIVDKVFHTVKETAIWTEAHFIHHILQWYKFSNIKGNLDKQGEIIDF